MFRFLFPGGFAWFSFGFFVRFLFLLCWLVVLLSVLQLLLNLLFLLHFQYFVLLLIFLWSFFKFYLHFFLISFSSAIPIFTILFVLFMLKSLSRIIALINIIDNLGIGNADPLQWRPDSNIFHIVLASKIPNANIIASVANITRSILTFWSHTFILCLCLCLCSGVISVGPCIDWSSIFCCWFLVLFCFDHVFYKMLDLA